VGEPSQFSALPPPHPSAHAPTHLRSLPQIGVTNTQSDVPPLTLVEGRTHFGAWCIVSAPLVLGMDLRDNQTLDTVWDVITNTEAIAVNQDYAGHSGSLFWEVGGRLDGHCVHGAAYVLSLP
jgi:hypothetical protein